MAAAPFTWADTHRAPQRAGLQISHSSESAGWPWLFASLQFGKDYEASFPAVENHLLVMLITGRIFFSGCIGTLSVRRTLLAGSVSLTPGGFDLTSQVKSDTSLCIFMCAANCSNRSRRRCLAAAGSHLNP